MSANSLNTQEEKDKRYNMAKVRRARPGKPLSKGSLESYQRKYSEEIAEDLAPLWGKSKRFTGLPKIEIEFTSYKPEAGGPPSKMSHRKVLGVWISGRI